MSAAIVKAAALAVLCLVPLGVAAQTGGGKSERGMPPDKAKTSQSKSERALPTQASPARTPPAATERAMPSDKK